MSDYLKRVGIGESGDYRYLKILWEPSQNEQKARIISPLSFIPTP